MDPRHMVAHPNDTSKFDAVLQYMLNNKRRTGAQCEVSSSQFKSFMLEVPRDRDRFKDFAAGLTDIVDVFFHEMLNDRPKFTSLWELFKLIITLSPGQINVERGFSVNKEMLANMEEKIFVAQRLVHDSVSSYGCEISEIPITKSLMTKAKTRFFYFFDVKFFVFAFRWY